MINIAGREAYFEFKEASIWFDLPLAMTFKHINFRDWVYRINGKVYPFCTTEFREEFNKAKLWEMLHQ